MIKLTDTEILLQAKTDPKLQEQILNDNIEFIWFALWRNTKPYMNEEDAGFDFEDLYQEACLAFVEAIHRFDPKKAAFTTFAESMIRWRLLRFFRDNHPGGVHLMRSKIDEGFKVPIDSLDRPIDGDNGKSLLDILEGENFDADADAHIDALKILRHMPLKTRQIAYYQYCGYTQVETARLLGVTQATVSRHMQRLVKAYQGIVS